MIHIIRQISKKLTAILSLLAIVGCADHFADEVQHSGQRLTVSGTINQQLTSRVSDGGFVNGDKMGVYVVDYEGNVPGNLTANDNRATNICHTLDESNGKWTPSRDIYWKDNHTLVDIYAYYPYAEKNADDVNDYSFTLQRDQSTSSADGTLGGYEASDYLWTKAEGVAPTENTVRLSLSHIMSSVRILLQEGSGFSQGEWDSLDKQVLIMNTSRQSSIDLSNGNVKVTGGIEPTATIPYHKNDEWRAIVLPQKVNAGVTMFSITVGGVPYKFSKSDDFLFRQGLLSSFTIRVDKTSDSGAYHLVLVGESIIDWENDIISHDASAREYLIVNSTAGRLKETITSAGKDYRKIKNLKITGTINPTDFYFMRDEMDILQSLNLREVTIASGEDSNDWGDTYGQCDRIPTMAFYNKISLLRVILPEKLKIIGQAAFDGCINLSGSLDVPEGVTRIEASAFCYCFSLTGTLTLPSTLEYIGGGGSVIGLGAFYECGFISELKLPERVKYIGVHAFFGCRGLYGSLHLPHSLTYVGTRAFAGCNNMTGSLSIPETLANIGEGAFSDTGLDGNLYLPEGVVTVGRSAFANTKLRGDLVLPNSLQVLANEAFMNCDFSGQLKLPSQLTMIGSNAFAGNWRLSGTVVMPETMQTIGAGAFSDCRGIEGVEFNADLETICSGSDGGGAFNNCYGITSIICHGSQPPIVQSGAFDGVPKDNFTLEVPDYALMQYQTAVGWREFKRIAAHHELVCRPSMACALSSEHSQSITVDAEGDWEISSIPDWCKVSQYSGTKKTTITLTISAMSDNSGKRQGNIVFRLKDKDYTHTCSVSQYGYAHAEDEVLTLQRASKGKGVNLVFLGDGYSAEDISNGKYLKNIKEVVEYFFAVEPYNTYRQYFNVYTMFPLSTESGVGTLNSVRYNRFGTSFTGGVGLRADYEEIFRYVQKIPNVDNDNIAETLIVMTPNSTEYGGITQMWDDGRAIAFCPMSNYEYPYDTRGVVQHEAGGHGFGKLADEYIYHNAFIDFCSCSCCQHVESLKYGQSLGWFQNLSLTNKVSMLPWAHLINDPAYSDIVDVFEGGYMHSRGVFRSENNSCMNNDIPYYSTISRESIVRRIMRYAGESFSYDDFVAHDKRLFSSGAKVFSRGGVTSMQSNSVGSHIPPVIHKTRR